MALGILAAAESIQPSRPGPMNGGPGDTPPDGRGDRIRGAAPKPANGLTVGTGNGINYHNGPVLHTVNLYHIYYGNWNQTSLNPTGTTYLDLFAKSIGGTPYFNINTTYGDNSGATVPNAVTYRGAYVDSGSLGTSLSDSSIATLVSNAINSNQWGTPGVADPNGLYLVLTAPGVGETSGFLNKYCGWHSWGSWGTTPVQYGFVGDAAGPSLGNCAEQTSVSPNGDPGVDAMTSVIAHELSETVSDPQGTAWYDSAGNENGDKCAWIFGPTSMLGSGALYNVTMGGSNYLIQQMWLNAQGGLCATSYATTPDFSVSVSGSQTVAQGGTSGTYTVTAAALNQFSLTTNPVSWSFGTLPSGITATPGTLSTTNSASFTLTTSAGIAPGTYSIPITGTSGSLVHTVNATLVVSAPTYSLSIVNLGTAIKRPTSGTTTTTYVVNVTPVGNFTTPVNLSASLSGRSTGVTASITGTNPVTPGSTGTLSIAVTNRAKSGPQTVTVTGSVSGMPNKQTTTTITIQ